MKTEKIKLSQLKVNAANPRTITDRKLRLLVERLLAFPKMIEIRPVVVDERMTALGGNMRLRAFTQISHMSLDDIATTLSKTRNFQRLTPAEKEGLLAQWQKWLDNPVVEVVRASTLSEAEKKEFVIADNASFGEWDYDRLANEWDYDRLANEWDNEELVSWGLDVWQPDQPFNSGGNSSGNSSGNSGLAQAESAEGGIPFDGSNLPPELQGLDISPDELPKIEGSDETLMERIIIVYPKDRADELAQLIGLPQIDRVVYKITDIIPEVTEE